MARWRNTGAPFQGIDRGEVFEAEPDDPLVVRRRHKLERVSSEDVGAKEKVRRGYPGVDFGSDRAYEVARDASPPVPLDTLLGAVGTGQDGALLVSDVERLIAERGDGANGE